MRNDLWDTTSIKYSTLILQKSAYLGYVSDDVLISSWQHQESKLFLRNSTQRFERIFVFILEV